MFAHDKFWTVTPEPMNPIPKWAGSNAALHAPPGMNNCGSLSVHRTADGQRCISCWRPSWRERISILFFGRVWVDVFSGSTQPPIALTGSHSYGTLGSQRKIDQAKAALEREEQALAKAYGK